MNMKAILTVLNTLSCGYEQDILIPRASLHSGVNAGTGEL